LIEHYAGALPVWLSPVQAIILTVTDRDLLHGEKVLNTLTDQGFRVESDIRNEKLGLKVREAQLRKIPYMLIIGDNESQNGGVTPRLRSGKNLPLMNLEEFVAQIQEDCNKRRE